MKLENLSRIHDKAVTEFCVARKEAFDDWCKREAYFMIERRTIFLGPLLLGAITVWNVYRTGEPLSVYCYIFPTLLLLIMTVRPIFFISIARESLDLVLTAIVLGALALMHLASTSNFPLQMALLTTAFSFWGTPKANYLRTGWFLGISCGFIAISNNISFSDVAVQLLTGSGIGHLFAIHNMKRKRHQFYTESLNIDMVNHAFNELKKVVPSHVVALIQERASLESTMPCDPGTACIISFDIVKSSQIEHPEFFKAANAMKNRCYRLLKEGYNAEGTESNGYRIKNTGDGFLCSIGYPYRPPADRSMVDVAHDLAESFAAIFDEEMANLRLPTSPRCSMGIAIGEIRGFFPDEEPRQYDLHGRVIMLATRYEAMRNKLLDHPAAGLSGNIIFIAEKVWLGLPDDKRSLYEPWECNSPDRKVRDDPSAKRAYFRISSNKVLP